MDYRDQAYDRPFSGFGIRINFFIPHEEWRKS